MTNNAIIALPVDIAVSSLLGHNTLLQAYSLDLRQRIVAALKQGGKQRQVAQRFDVSLTSVQRYHRREQQQQSLKARTAPGKKPALSTEQEPPFVAMLTQEQEGWV